MYVKLLSRPTDRRTYHSIIVFTIAAIHQRTIGWQHSLKQTPLWITWSQISLSKATFSISIVVLWKLLMVWHLVRLLDIPLLASIISRLDYWHISKIWGAFVKFHIQRSQAARNQSNYSIRIQSFCNLSCGRLTSISVRHLYRLTLS